MLLPGGRDLIHEGSYGKVIFQDKTEGDYFSKNVHWEKMGYLLISRYCNDFVDYYS